jgi:hypothetical protein
MNNNIAIFMGHKTIHEYDKSWDELIPVIEKISKIPFDGRDTFYPRTFGMTDEEGNFMFRFNGHCLFAHKELIKAAYAAVVDLIKTYDNGKDN